MAQSADIAGTTGQAQTLMRADNNRSADICYYPLFVALRGKVCLVVGGGAVGERKIRGLLEHGAAVRLVARKLTPWLQAQRENGSLTFLGESYEEAQLEQVDLVFAATSEGPLNRIIAEHARNRRLWCNMATEPELGSFILPALFEQGPLSIAVSTSGLSPALARRIRNEIRQCFAPEWTSVLSLLGLLRTAIQAKGLPTAENHRLFNEVADLPLIEWVQEKRWTAIGEAIHGICQPRLTMEELQRIMERVW